MVYTYSGVEPELKLILINSKYNAHNTEIKIKELKKVLLTIGIFKENKIL